MAGSHYPSQIAVVQKENPAGRAITKLLTTFELEPDHQRYFIRPVGREEAVMSVTCEPVKQPHISQAVMSSCHRGTGLGGDPKQSPGGVADGQRAHRTLLLPSDCEAHMPSTCHMSSQGFSTRSLGFRHNDLEKAAAAASQKPLGGCWFRPDKVGPRPLSPTCCSLRTVTSPESIWSS